MATPAEELDVDGVKVRLTNPDKVYYPKLGSDGTKRKLVEYYLAVAGGPMPMSAFTSGVGVDILSLGATKNGALFGEAVVVLNQDAVSHMPDVRSRMTTSLAISQAI